MKIARLTLIFVLGATLSVGPALAQAARPAPPRPPAPAAPPPQTEPAIPYEPQLLRLAEILGSLTYLRDLCGAGDADKWRTQMTALLAAEGATVARKERLAGSFNKGFRGYEQTYRV